MKRNISGEYLFRSSASQFRKEEQEALKIEIRETEDIKEILQYTDPEIQTLDEHELYLPEYDRGKIVTYEMGGGGLSKIQKRNQEKYIDELATFLCDVFNLDDGKQLIMKPSNLKLRINQEEFAFHADREGIKRNKLIWVLQEDKHLNSKSYLHGDIQLACSMIAAAQYNESLCPTSSNDYKILGLKFVGDRVVFCSAVISRYYLEELNDGLPKESGITLIKYKALELSRPSDRRVIVKLFNDMREEAISI